MATKINAEATSCLWIKMEENILLAERQEDPRFIKLLLSKTLFSFSGDFCLKISENAISMIFFAEKYQVEKYLCDGERIRCFVRDDETYAEKNLKYLGVIIRIDEVFKKQIELQGEVFFLARKAFNLALDKYVGRSRKTGDYPTVELPSIGVDGGVCKYDANVLAKLRGESCKYSVLSKSSKIEEHIKDLLGSRANYTMVVNGDFFDIKIVAKKK